VATRFASYRVILRLLEPIEAKLQLPLSVDHFTDHFARRLAAQPLPPFLFAVSRGQRVLFQCISVSMKFDSLYLKKALELYTPTITCCSGTSWIKMGFSVDPSARVLLRVSRIHWDETKLRRYTGRVGVCFFLPNLCRIGILDIRCAERQLCDDAPISTL